MVGEMTNYDEEEEEIKRRKLAEYRRMLEEARIAEEERRKYEARREAVLRSILTPQARQRLANIKLIRPEYAEAVENQLIQLVQTGRLTPPIDDSLLKRLLLELDRRLRREVKVHFRR